MEWGLAMSPVRQVLDRTVRHRLEEFELEVMRDLKDNVVIICPIEISTRWASTPATASPWRRRSRSPTRNTR